MLLNLELSQPPVSVIPRHWQSGTWMGSLMTFKDKIYAYDPPEHLDDLIDIAIRLDSRMELRCWVLLLC